MSGRRLPAVELPEPGAIPTFRQAMDQAERDYLVSVLEGRTVANAVRLSGLHRSTFYALLAKHGCVRYAKTGHRGNWNGL